MRPRPSCAIPGRHFSLMGEKLRSKSKSQAIPSILDLIIWAFRRRRFGSP